MRAKGSLIASIVVLVLVATVDAGGWAIRTVRDLPDYAVAGIPFPLTFMLRGHGMDPLTGLTPAVSAKSGTDTVNATAVGTKTAGEYTATLVLPRPGKWTITIGPAGGTSTLLPLTVIAPGKPAPPPLSAAELGERLFVAKGCLGCHVNRDVHGKNLVEAGPELTGRRFSGTYLRNLLANPQAVFARAPEPETRDSEVVGWEMPNLELKEPEIAALVAFINRR